MLFYVGFFLEAQDIFYLRSTATQRLHEVSKKSIKMTVVIVLTYLMCWIPYWIYAFLDSVR